MRLGSSAPARITQLLLAWGGGDEGALGELITHVYAELRRMAARQLRAEPGRHRWQPTALVHEAYVRLIDQRRVQWRNRTQFFAVAARIMRRVLVDQARADHAAKRGRGWEHVSLDIEERAHPRVDGLVDVIHLDNALQRLAVFDPQQARIVELRYFGGLTIDETADVLKVSAATVAREWTIARAWLRAELTR